MRATKVLGPRFQPSTSQIDRHSRQWGREPPTERRGLEDARHLFMQRKIFWLSFAALSIIADLALPLLWAILATLPIVVLSWWIAYRSDWF